ncbi:MAG: type III-A CRISPR-associated RAMP protein Csm3 [Desulfobacterales bacterium]|nr:type III-A CRISPR-associated RAMP protein Csm3 [Desulfobacterales bacterium]
MANIPNIEFKSKIFVSGTLTNLTGMHIGGNSTEMSIGGADSIVVRNPLTNHPYIPGSSLRGKMRSLLERIRGEMTIDLEKPGERQVKYQVKFVKDLEEPLSEGAKLKSAGPSTSPEALSSKFFGVAVDKHESERPEDVIPQRLVVRDAELLNPKKLEEAKNTDMPLTEVKTEVAIDRITSKANPRQIERVPAGAEFGFQFILNLFGEDDETGYVNLLFQCMELLQDDYLGGHGGRGYGRVRFELRQDGITCKTAEDYRENRDASRFEIDIPENLQPLPEE